MITLNLIPESIREENALRHVYSLNVRLGLIIFYILMTVGVLTQVAKYVLISGFEAVKTQSDLITQNYKAYNVKAREINTKINQINQVVFDNHHWNILILDIANLLPQGVTLSNLSFNRASKSMRLAGVAATRDDLLKLKEEVDKWGYAEKLQLPINILLEKNNIYFDLESKVDYERHEMMN